MARLARFVVPGAAHHVTRRGNGRQQTFFRDTDYAACRDMLATQCAALSKVHRAYAGRIRARGKRTGHFRQGRFGCVAMDEPQQSHVPLLVGTAGARPLS